MFSSSRSENAYQEHNESYSVDMEEGDTRAKPTPLCQSRSIIFSAVLVAIVILIVTLSVQHGLSSTDSSSSPDLPLSLIIMVPDGTGPAVSTMARDLLRYETNNNSVALNLDSYVVGTVATYATDALVTDSAASATAYACGIKTYNGAIAIDDERKPIATVMEAAKRKGMLTGALVTSRVTHATPASFTSHVQSRSQEEDIAIQQALWQDVDFLIGGGRNFFDPTTRSDGQDLIQSLKDRGYSVFTDRDGYNEFVAADDPFPAFGLLANSHLDYEIDREKSGNNQPSLSEMTSALISHLSDESIIGPGGRGFLILIEGSRIDHAGHANDAAAHVREMLQFDQAFQLVQQFSDSFPNVEMISVADHATGGMALARDPLYAWYPSVLSPVDLSTDSLAPLLVEANSTWYDVWLQHVSLTLTMDEQMVMSALVASQNLNDVSAEANTLISNAARVSWSTSGHDAVDVNIYGSGAVWDHLRGHHDNTEIGNFAVEFLGLREQLLEIQEILISSSNYSQSITSGNKLRGYHE